MKSKSF